MNSLKKTVLTFGLGVLVFGLSAFKAKRDSFVFVYYKVEKSHPAANNPHGYMYFEADHCEAGGDLCSAQWDIGWWTPPADGNWLPTTGVFFQTGSVVTGHYE